MVQARLVQGCVSSGVSAWHVRGWHRAVQEQPVVGSSSDGVGAHDGGMVRARHGARAWEVSLVAPPLPCPLVCLVLYYI